MRLRETFSFRGRIRRATFWGTWAVLTGVTLLNFVIAGMLMPSDPAQQAVGGLIAMPGLIAVLVAFCAAQVKRWHDLDRSGWMVLINCVPIVGGLVNIVCLGFLRGTPGPNRFGEVEGVAPAGGEPPALHPVPPAKPWSPGARRALIAVAVALVVAPTLGGLWWMLPGAGGPARKSWLMAKLGSAAECHAMGLRCRSGAGGFRADNAQAAAWFERAAQKGHVRAQYDLAVLKFYGLGLDADSAQARRWLEAAVQQDYAPAMTLLGLLHEQAEPGNATSFALWQKAASAGDPWAESLLGSAYLARSNPVEGDEALVRALFWLESARRHGVETVGGLLQHVWANVPEERVEAVTDQVFARLDRGADTAVDEFGTAASQTETTAPASQADDAAATALGNEVLDIVRGMADYVHISTLYAERSQSDPAWPNSDEGRAVGRYLQRMRSDALSTRPQADGDTLVIEYSVGGVTRREEGVRAGDFAHDADYRSFTIENIARNIVTAPRPLRVSTFLRDAEAKGEEQP